MLGLDPVRTNQHHSRRWVPQPRPCPAPCGPRCARSKSLPAILSNPRGFSPTLAPVGSAPSGAIPRSWEVTGMFGGEGGITPYLPVLRPSGRAARVQNRSRRYCRTRVGSLPPSPRWLRHLQAQYLKVGSLRGCLAERVGFEPTDPLLEGHSISSRAHSTTLAPLLIRSKTSAAMPNPVSQTTTQRVGLRNTSLVFRPAGRAARVQNRSRRFCRPPQGPVVQVTMPAWTCLPAKTHLRSTMRSTQIQGLGLAAKVYQRRRPPLTASGYLKSSASIDRNT